LTTSRYRDTIMTVKKRTKENKLIDMELLEEVAPTLRALAHPMRLRIIDFLKHGEQPVSKIIEATGKSQALTSHQLGLLRAHGVVKARREGNRVFYRIVDGPALVLLGCIQNAREGTGTILRGNASSLSPAAVRSENKDKPKKA